jgi:uncharacterized protein (TIGR02145 family)
MKKLNLFSVVMLITGLAFFTSCKKDKKEETPSPTPTNQTVKDYDGNEYHTVKIGTQTWMVENLKVTHYRNGDAIPNVTNSTWDNLTTGAYCDYNNTPSNSITYGRLYNWYAVHDSRNIAPTGWHVPSDAEWTILENYLGGDSIAGGKLKVTSSNSPAWDGTNTSGFSALPAGYSYSGTSNDMGTYAYFWSVTEVNATGAWSRELRTGYAQSGRTNLGKIVGFSVRCLQN